MISGLLKKIFGSRNDRLIRQYGQAVRAINALEPAISALTDEQLRGKTDEFRRKLSEARRSSSSCRKPSPWCARPASGRSACDTSTCS